MKTKKFDIYTSIEPIDIVQYVIYCGGEEKINCVELRFNGFNKPQNVVIEDINKLNQQLAEKHKKINQKAIEELTKLFDKVQEIYHTNEMDKAWLLDYIQSTIFKLK